MSNTLKTLKWISGSLEAVLGMPIASGIIILTLAWTPGNVLGIVTSAVGWIPLVGMVMHILTATYTMMDAAKRPEYWDTILIDGN